MTDNANLHLSRVSKTDEFYTQLNTIEDELRHYRNYFKDKIVFCNCDDPYESNFFKYFAMNFNFLGLKKLITTCYASSPIVYTQLSFMDNDDSISTASKDKRPYKIEITKVTDENKDGAINLSDVEILLKNKKNVLTVLKDDGDFRSPECMNLLNKCDVVVTNPPFSLMKEYLPMLINSGKQFLILGNTNHITLKELTPCFLNRECWLGNNSGHFWFMVPDYYEIKETDFRIDENGQKWRRMGNICWFTNMDIPRRHEPLDLYAKYNKDIYPKYDGCDAIECNTYKKIPENYFGVIGVPISYMCYHCPDQFEILDIVTPKINGKTKYKRLLIKRKRR